MDTKVAKVFPGAPAHAVAAEPVAGRYRIHTRLGRGRLGEIYEATDERDESFGVDRRVAIQLLPGSIAFNDAGYQKLKTGFGGLLVKSHPNIVEYHDIGRDKRFGYVVMERLEGASLRKILDLESTLPLSDTSAVVNGIGRALEFLHGRSITHGNVTARNIFVTDELEFRLLDVVPVPHPEPDARTTVDAGIADDLYDLACLAYEMLSGRHPYNFHDRLHAARAGLVPERVESLPEREWRALERALGADASRGPATITAFLRDFCVGRTERPRRSGTPGIRAVSQPATADTSEESAVTAPLARTEPSRRRETLRANHGDRGDNRRDNRDDNFDDHGDDSRAKRRGETGSLLLLVILVALGAWGIAGQPQADVANLLASMGPVIAPPEPARISVPPAAAPATVPAGDSAADDGAETDAGTEPTTDSAAADEAGPPADTPPAATEAATAGSAAEATASDTAPVAATPAFEASFVAVSEGDAAARLPIRLPEASTSGYFWWTRPHGAQPEEDYVAVRAQPVYANEAEPTSTVLVPLVNDGRPEAPEDFFVHVGERNADGRLVPVDTIRVDIVDDD